MYVNMVVQPFLLDININKIILLKQKNSKKCIKYLWINY